MQTTGDQKPLKVHRSLVDAIVTGLRRIFFNGERSDKVVYEIIRGDRRWGSRDRNFIASSIFDIARFRRRLWNDLGEAESLETIALMRLWAAYHLSIGMSIPDWPELHGIKFKAGTESWKINASVGDETDELGRGELGNEVWEKAVDSMNRLAAVFIRVNTICATCGEVSLMLTKEGIENVVEEGSCLRLMTRKKITGLPAFKEGLFEIQDLSSQMVAPFLGLSAGMSVADICAGGGGKTLHMAALMDNKGKIIASDISRGRLTQLVKRAERAGVKIVEVLDENERIYKEFSGRLDRILIDAPCTGSGVFRREPEKKYRITRERLEGYVAVQAELLMKGSALLKPGGKLVYSTCSIFPSENQKQVAGFLAQHPDFAMEEEKVIMPYDHDSDGFYMARIAKKS